MVSDRKLHANRLNAQHSTGPRTKEGKARSSRNASTHGLFCKELLLPYEHKELFHVLRNSLLMSLSPQNVLELSLVDDIVIARWKLIRLQNAERVLHMNFSDQLHKQSHVPPKSHRPAEAPPVPDSPGFRTQAYALLGHD